MVDAVLLDTCAVIWLATADKSLSRTANETIARATTAYVSPISGWEIAVKCHKGKLSLPCEPREWFSRVVKKHDLSVLPLTLNDMMTASELPWLHGDPADRFIIAAAKNNHLPVVTADGNFARYGIETIS